MYAHFSRDVIQSFHEFFKDIRDPRKAVEITGFIKNVWFALLEKIVLGERKSRL